MSTPAHTDSIALRGAGNFSVRSREIRGLVAVIAAIAPACGRGASASHASGGHVGSESGGGPASSGEAGVAGRSAASGGVATGGTSGASNGAAGALLQGGAAGAPASGGSAGSAGATIETDTETSWTITSPGEVVRATVELADRGGSSGYPVGKRLYYRVEVRGASASATVVQDSPLGITRSDQAFVDGLSFVSAGPRVLVDEPYAMIVGKKSLIQSRANERVLQFAASGGGLLELVLRGQDDGFAFRYRFPETSNADYTVVGESTGFKIPAGSHGWLSPYDVAGMWGPAYESNWQNEVPVGTQSPTAPGWCLPALFRTPSNHWVFLTDTAVDGSYFAAHLAGSAANDVYRIAMPVMDEGNSVGSINPSSTLPWSTPWRLVITGKSPAVIVESTLPTDVAPPSALQDPSWIRPGRASWSWWSDDNNPKSYSVNTSYVDLSRDMTWEYSLVDNGWDQMSGGGTWRDLVTYAAARNVGLWVWYNSGGAHNSIDMGPRHRMNERATRRSELESISKAGVKGIKLDFFHSDKPWMMKYYEDILRDAAEFRLLVDFHGSTVPRGWQRTYPNLMSAEAVRGSEWYKYDAAFPADQPRRNTILPFTRNVMGSMDFTPAAFTNHNNPHRTTYAHELALSIVFESAIQHFPDRVSGYSALSAGPRTFLQQVPTTWDDIRFLEGIPGQWIVLARRKGTTWYVAGICGEDQSRELELSLGFLDAGSYTASIIADGESDASFSERTEVVSRTGSLSVSLRAHGGFVAKLSP